MSNSFTIQITPDAEGTKAWILHVAKSDLPCALALATHMVGTTGEISLKELAEAAGCTPPKVTRTEAMAEAVGQMDADARAERDRGHAVAESAADDWASYTADIAEEFRESDSEVHDV